MPTEEPAIQLLPVPAHWAPAGQGPEPGADSPVPAPAPDQGPALPRQFATLLTEVLAGVRPERQVTPWLSKRGTLHLHRLMPLFQTGYQPRIMRVLTTRPAPHVVEMTVIAAIGPRPRALAIRLEHDEHQPRWHCTDIESALVTSPMALLELLA